MAKRKKDMSHMAPTKRVARPKHIEHTDDHSGDVYFTHSEFVTNIVATAPIGVTTTPFQQQQFLINPGLPSSFPYLSQVASAFQLYKFDALIYTFKPLTGEGAGITNALGKVIMATSYDPELLNALDQNGPYTSSVQMETAEYATCQKPSLAQHQPIEVSAHSTATNLLYVRTGPVPRSRIFTDTAQLIIGSEGIPVSSVTGTPTTVITNVLLGELWVSYRIRLCRALLYESLLNNNIPTDWYRGFSIADSASWCQNALQGKSDNSIVGADNTNRPATLATAGGMPNYASATFGTFSNTGWRLLYGADATSRIARNTIEYWFPLNISVGAYEVTILARRNAATGADDDFGDASVYGINIGPVPNIQSLSITGNGGTSIAAASWSSNWTQVTAATGSNTCHVRFMVFVQSPGINQAKFQCHIPGLNAGQSHVCQVEVTAVAYSKLQNTAVTSMATA